MSGNASRLLLVLFLAALLPLGANFIYILSNRYVSDLMRYSFVLCPVGIVMILDHRADFLIPSPGVQARKAGRSFLLLLAAVTILNNVIYSNQLYLLTSLEEQATLSAMTRVIYHMETTPGYVPGETIVVQLGDLNNSRIAQQRPGYPDEHITFSMQPHFGTSYNYAYQFYFNYVIGYPIRFGSQEVIDKYTNDPAVISMPAFPEPGCCQMIDGILIMKLS